MFPVNIGYKMTQPTSGNNLSKIEKGSDSYLAPCPQPPIFSTALNTLSRTLELNSSTSRTFQHDKPITIIAQTKELFVKKVRELLSNNPPKWISINADLISDYVETLNSYRDRSVLIKTVTMDIEMYYTNENFKIILTKPRDIDGILERYLQTTCQPIKKSGPSENKSENSTHKSPVKKQKTQL